MGQVIELSTDQVAWGQALRQERVSAELSLRQAAAALEVSPITLDGWEQGRKPQVKPEFATARFAQFRVDTECCWRAGNNLLFGVFPLRIARDILGLTVDEMAVRCGYSRSSWSKMEANARIVPEAKLFEVEGWVRAAWDHACVG